MSDPMGGAAPVEASEPSRAVVRQSAATRIRGSLRYRVLLGVLGVAAVASLVNLGWHHVIATRGAEQGATLIAGVVAAGGPQVVVVALQRDIAPIVTTPARRVDMTDLDPIDELEALAALRAALDVYPPGFVHRLVDRVALAGAIRFFGDTTVGGFFGPRTVAINCGGDWTAEHRQFVTTTFHHEFSSLVRQAAPLDEAAWVAANPPGFTYLSYAQFRAMLKSDTPDLGSTALYEQGFARAYGMTDTDNDFNTFAERIFGDGATFAREIGPYPRMRAKTRLFIDTYERMEPRLAAYFDRTGLRAAAR